MEIWDFIQDEILGMRWLNRLIGVILDACGLDTSGRLGGSIQFFIYDVIKIMDNTGSWDRKSLRSDPCSDMRHSDVCGYLWMYTYRRSIDRKRRKAWRGSCLYDGSYHAIAAVNDNAEKSDKGEAAWDNRCGMHVRDHYCGIFIQCSRKLY